MARKLTDVWSAFPKLVRRKTVVAEAVVAVADSAVAEEATEEVTAIAGTLGNNF
jgi:hypothetical protein